LLNGKSYEVRYSYPAGALTLQTAHQEFTAEVIDREPGAAAAMAPRSRRPPANPRAHARKKSFACWFKPERKSDAGQGLLVVEAMKMQNEIRSPKSGTVERLLVKEGQR